MATILLSIYPKYIKLIAIGRKKYEFRKFRSKMEINKIIIYAMKPYSCIVGEAEVSKTLLGAKDKIWEITKEFSGISREEYFGYFHNVENALAYRIENFKIYQEHKKLEDIGINGPPQSFYYLDLEQYKKLMD